MITPHREQKTVVTDRVDPTLLEYRAVSVAALVGLLLALASAAAFWHPVLWSLPLIAVIVNSFALRRISQDSPRLVGRAAALSGLALAVAVGVAAPTRHFGLQARAEYEARKLVQSWFDALKNQGFDQAFELTLEVLERQPTREDRRAFYANEPKARNALRAFSTDAVVRAIAELGDAAQVRFLETRRYHATPYKERVWSLWAVTYEQQGRPTSFLVQAEAERDITSPRRVRQWKITAFNLVERPLENRTRPAGTAG